MGTIRKNKKAIFFTILSILTLALLFAIFSPHQFAVEVDEPLSQRLSTLNSFVKQLTESFIPLGLQSSVAQAIQATVIDMNQTGRYLTDPETELGQVALTGFLDGRQILFNGTFTNLSNSIALEASRAYNLDLTIQPHSIILNHTSPWDIDVKIIVDIQAVSETAQWRQNNVEYSTKLAIEGFYDPRYVVNVTGGHYGKRIKQAETQPHQWNIANTTALIRNETYTHFENSVAPTYLMRFTNTSSPSECCGIVSLVNPQRLNTIEHNESYVDYQFFNNSIRCSDMFIGDDFNILGGNPASFERMKLNFDYAIKFNVSEEMDILTC